MSSMVRKVRSELTANVIIRLGCRQLFKWPNMKLLSYFIFCVALY